MVTVRAKVQSRGQLTLPQEVRQVVGVNPGDTVLVRAAGPHLIEVQVLPCLSLDELIEEWQTDEPVDVDALLEEAREVAADDVIARLHE